MRVINIVDSVNRNNYGVWNAALINSAVLLKSYDVKSELWYPSNQTFEFAENYPTVFNYKINIKKLFFVEKIIKERKLTPENDIIVTHGCWGLPTFWGFRLRQKGFTWIYVPHAMLENWAFNEKRLKKSIYFKLIEFNLSKRANLIRAVGNIEYKNLKRLYKFSQLVVINNCVEGFKVDVSKNGSKSRIVLFMSRLHKKKGIVLLVKAWFSSRLNNNKDYSLIIAGPDDGELFKIKNLISSNSNNIFYVGPVYGDKKEELLSKSCFYVLPSFSEGFPVSILEAMQAGCICLITDDANFPEAFEKGVAIKITNDINTLTESLNSLIEFKEENIKRISEKGQAFIKENYSTEIISKEYYNMLVDLKTQNLNQEKE